MIIVANPLVGFEEHSLAKKTINKVVIILLMCLAMHTHQQIINYIGCSSTTVTSYMNYFRELVAKDIDVEWSVIGGEDVEVKVDESKFAK